MDQLIIAAIPFFLLFLAIEIVVLRHAEAVKRKAWPAEDRLRPLSPDGHAQAIGLVPLLAAYGVDRIISSS